MKGYPMYPYIGWQTKTVMEPVAFPPQHQDHMPGLEYLMNPDLFLIIPVILAVASSKEKSPSLRAGIADSDALSRWHMPKKEPI